MCLSVDTHALVGRGERRGGGGGGGSGEDFSKCSAFSPSLPGGEVVNLKKWPGGIHWPFNEPIDQNKNSMLYIDFMALL